MELQKQILIVIGKMGHGKSSFIREFLDQQQKSTIVCSNEAQSCTLKCSSYKISDISKKMLNIPIEEQVYLLDTPGTNSYSKNYQIMQEIRAFVIQNKFVIVGIIFIRSATDLRQQLDPNNYKTFFEIFPIKRSMKEKISMYVFTQYDKQFSCSQQLESNVQSMKQLFKNSKILFFSQRNLYWCSNPESQQDRENIREMLSLKRFQSQKNIKQKQWQILGTFLKDRHSFYVGYEQFEKTSMEYNQKVKHNILKKMQSKQSQMTRSEIVWGFETNGQISKGAVGLTALGVSGLYVAPVGAVVISQAAVITGAALIGWIAAPIVIGCSLIYAAKKIIQSNKQQNIKNGIQKMYEIRGDEQQQQNQKKILQKILESYLNQFLRKQFISNCDVVDDKLLMNKFSWIQSICVAESSLTEEGFSFRKWIKQLTGSKGSCKVMKLEAHEINKKSVYILKTQLKKAYNIVVHVLVPSASEIRNIIFQTLQNQYNIIEE